jgi:hypothetical protein
MKGLFKKSKLAQHTIKKATKYGAKKARFAD